MQKDMAKAQEELAEKVLEGTAGGEVVDPEDIDMLQDLVLAATNDALKKVDELTNETMGQFTKGMNMPGLF
ncbi:hypothetical protein CGLO_14089 [Colletotrichum gloeosporioides Cg-14]|uniref:Nucleoid-associated protein n=1 Tax=Colletotrichum gloeosporioides (strain Cg-14) TaxID=1237896 RepID=T0JV14_COLGC|nr:hypothetical protein CGLO_14089 [Colletotrichum gloeosporioides Cg-14]